MNHKIVAMNVLFVLLLLSSVGYSQQQLPINLPIGSSCTWDYQCLSNYCPDGKCATSQASGIVNGGACSQNSNCLSNLCLLDVDGIHMICAGNDLGIGSVCIQHSQCISGNCVGHVCTVAESQLPINLPNGKSCTWNYQCLSNNCASGHCAASDADGTIINGGSCSTHKNCISNFCVFSDPKLGGTGGYVCADPNAPDRIMGIGQMCGYTLEGVKLVCASNAFCSNHVCVSSNNDICYADSDCSDGNIWTIDSCKKSLIGNIIGIFLGSKGQCDHYDMTLLLIGFGVLVVLAIIFVILMLAASFVSAAKKK